MGEFANKDDLMIRLKFVLSLLLLLTVLVPPVQTQEVHSDVTRIGRGVAQSVEWHPRGDYILVSTITGTWLYTPELDDMAHLPDAWLATVSPDGRYIAGVDADSHIRLWDAITLEPIESPDNGYFFHVKALAWSHDGRYLAAAGTRDQDLIYVWDLSNSQDMVFAIPNSADRFLWSPDAHRLAMLDSQGGGLVVFDVDHRETLLTRPAADVPHASQVAWQDSDKLLVSEYGENTDVSSWNVTTGEQEESWRLPGHSVPYSNRAGDSLATGVPGGIEISHAGTGDDIRVETGDDYFGTLELAWSHNNRWLAAGTYSIGKSNPAETLLINPHTGEIVQRFGGAYQTIRHLSWSQDDR
ncbi:MAG TPA: WD40 repeat domain-containing protein [Aggregatilinea sp.]|nr:WD40 repeat domain-containing protein [Aggregatilinea sp.]